MNGALLLSAALMGLAGTLHCFAMCGAASASVLQACGSGSWTSRMAGLLSGRLLGYALAGALAASSVEVLARLGAMSPVLRPIWTLVHLAALALGLWMLFLGRQPAWFEKFGRLGVESAAAASGSVPVAKSPSWSRVNGPARALVLGGLWWAWPCGLLQSALVVASLANGPIGGAAVMSVFAVCSAGGLIGTRWLLEKLGQLDAQGGRRLASLITRFAGLTLVAGASWALGHDVLSRFVAYCMS